MTVRPVEDSGGFIWRRIGRIHEARPFRYGAGSAVANEEHGPGVTEGRQACHRHLLGVVDRNEYELARRDLALEILDDPLGDDVWHPQSVRTVADIEIGTVEEAELERRFKAALRAWGARCRTRGCR